MAPTITRHVGKLRNSGIRVVVLMRKLPEDQANCLVVESDRLPDMYHDNLMNMVQSAEAQQTTELCDVLQRRTFTDGSPVLQTLHLKTFIRKVSIEDVDLYPLPNHPLPLAEANREIDQSTATSEAITAEDAATAVPETITESGTVAPNTEAEAQGDPAVIAKTLIAQAKLLEDEAKAKKERAYTLDPSLKPKRGRPKASAEQKEAARQIKNAKQRERNQAKKQK